MKSVGRWKASKLRFFGVLVLVLGVGNGLNGSANADGCDESEEPCIEVVEDRIVIRDNHAIRSMLEAERERMHQEALMAELERKRQMEAARERQQCRDRVAREVAAEAAAAAAACATALALTPIPGVDEAIAAATCAAVAISYSVDRQNEACGNP